MSLKNLLSSRQLQYRVGGVLIDTSANYKLQHVMDLQGEYSKLSRECFISSLMKQAVYLKNSQGQTKSCNLRKSRYQIFRFVLSDKYNWINDLKMISVHLQIVFCFIHLCISHRAWGIQISYSQLLNCVLLPLPEM